MRRPRALAEPGKPGLYHVCSRVVDKRVIFGERERRKFMGFIKGGARFAGVELVSWCLMGNHFHLLVRVPPVDADAMEDEEVFSRMENIYTEPRMRHFRGIWERLESDVSRKQFLSPFRARMGNLSDFVKTLKQRFSQWFNGINNREGTLWEGRFFSVMLSHNEKENGQGLGLLARFVAGYIDLNPVRAKVARQAEDKDWSSYGAAVRGDVDALAGIRILWGEEVSGGLDAKSMLRHHGLMLERARFNDGGEEQVAVAADGGNSGRLTVMPSSKSAVAGETEVGVARARSGNREEDGAISFGTTKRSAEEELLSKMGERCEALTKGHALGANWVVAQVT